MKLQLSYETEDASGGALEFAALLIEQDGLRAVFADETSSALLFSYNGAAFKRAEFNPLVTDSVEWQEALELDGDEELEIRDEAGRKLVVAPRGIRFTTSTEGISALALYVSQEALMRWRDIPGTWLEGAKSVNEFGKNLIIAPKSYFLPRQSQLDRSPRARPSALAEGATFSS
jgi:hypothetical protein